MFQGLFQKGRFTLLYSSVPSCRSLFQYFEYFLFYKLQIVINHLELAENECELCLKTLLTQVVQNKLSFVDLFVLVCLELLLGKY